MGQTPIATHAASGTAGRPAYGLWISILGTGLPPRSHNGPRSRLRAETLRRARARSRVRALRRRDSNGGFSLWGLIAASQVVAFEGGLGDRDEYAALPL
jgi:hypothetical protein